MPSSQSFSISRMISACAPTSMPRVGSSRIRKRGSVASQRARMTFCWLPPDRNLIGFSRSLVADVERGDVAVGDLLLLAPRQGLRPAAPRLQREDDVLAHRQVVDDAVVLAVLGAEAEAAGDRGARRGDRSGFAVDPHLAAVGLLDAEQELGGLGAARAEQAGHAHHLALADVEVEGRDAAAFAEVAEARDDGLVLRGDGAVAARLLALEFAAEHHRDEVDALQPLDRRASRRGGRCAAPSPGRRRDRPGRGNG